MYCFYWIRWVLVLWASGMLVYNSIFFNKISAGNRFIVGVTSAPLILSSFDYILGLVWPGAPVCLFQYGCALLAMLYLYHNHNYRIILELISSLFLRIKDRIISIDKQHIVFIIVGGLWFVVIGNAYVFRMNVPEWFINLPIYSKKFDLAFTIVIFTAYIFFAIGRQTWKKVLRELTGLIVVCTGMLVAFCLVMSAVAYSMDEYPGSDEAHYRIQARYFAEDRNSWEIDDYKGDKAGTVLADDHGPLWEVVNADAYFFTDDLMDDEIVRIMNSFLGGLFFIAIFNFADMIAGVLAAELSILMILFYRFSLDFTFSGSREPYRFIALYFYVIFMYSYIMSIIDNKKEKDFVKPIIGLKQKMVWFLGVLVISFLGINGHGSNVVIMFSIFLIYTVVAIWGKIGLTEYMITGVATLTGILCCLLKNIKRYFIEGSFISSTTWALRGTSAATAIERNSNARGNIKCIVKSYYKEDRALIIFGIVSILTLLIYYIVRIHRNHGNCISLLLKKTFINTIISIGMLFPIMGLYDVLGYKFSVWLAEQTRYRMYFLIVFAIMSAIFISLMCRSKNRYSRDIGYVISLCVCMISMSVTFKNMRIPQRVNFETGLAQYHINTSDDIIKNDHTGGNIFVSDQILEYYFRIPTKLGFTDYNHPILAASSDKEIEKSIDELNMEVFVFSYQDGYYHYDLLPFYRYLNTSPNVKKVIYNYGNSLNYQIDTYVVDKSIWDK